MSSSTVFIRISRLVIFALKFLAFQKQCIKYCWIPKIIYSNWCVVLWAYTHGQTDELEVLILGKNKLDEKPPAKKRALKTNLNPRKYFQTKIANLYFQILRTKQKKIHSYYSAIHCFISLLYCNKKFLRWIDIDDLSNL